jgi:hypothetical protein
VRLNAAPMLEHYAPIVAQLPRDVSVRGARPAQMRRKTGNWSPAAIGPPLLGYGKDLLLCGKVAELIGGLNCLTERKVAGQDHILPLQRNDQGPPAQSTAEPSTPWDRRPDGRR